MECDGCQSVRYCSDKCREDHREEHEEECKNRKAWLHDRKLFTQPDETHLGECPICFLPRPIDRLKSAFQTCCSNYICNGCAYSHRRSSGGRNCPFCREPSADDDGEEMKRLMKRVEANDPAALFQKGDYDGAFEYLTNAAELGFAEAHNNLGVAYRDGEGVEKDEDKAVYHFEKAAICGNPDARHNLAAIEEKNGNIERSVKHLIIAANQ